MRFLDMGGLLGPRWKPSRRRSPVVGAPQLAWPHRTPHAPAHSQVTAAAHPIVAAHLHRQIEVDGYAVVPLLDAAEVAEVKAIHERFGPAPGDPRTGLFNDTWATDIRFKRELSAALTAVMEPPARTVVPGARFLGWTSIMKWAGSDGTVVAHRDPTFVDEPDVRSLGIWCALDDLDVEDGTLLVIPGSHRGAPNVRPHQDGANLCPSIPLDGTGSAIAVPVPAGSAIVYDHALVHGSGPNRTHRVRTIVAGLAVPADAATSYALRVGDEVVLVEIDGDFFLEHKVDALDVDAVLAHRRIVRTLPAPPG